MSREASVTVGDFPIIWRIRLGVLALALVARLVTAMAIGGQFRFSDETAYVDAAERLVDGLGFNPAYSSVPAYPAFLALLRLFIPENLVAIRVAQASVLAFGCILCYELARRVQGELAGLGAAALYALDPLLIVSAALVYPESPALLVLTAALLAAWDATRRSSLVLCAVSGALLGLLGLLRPVGLVLVPVMVAWVALTPERTWGRRAAYGVVLAGTCLLALSPWMVRNYRVHGDFRPIATSGLGGVPVIGAEFAQRGVSAALVSAARQDPRGFLRRTLNELGHFWELYPTRMVTDNPDFAAHLSRQDPRLSDAPLVRQSWRDMVSAGSFSLEVALAVVGVILAWKTRRREVVWLGATLLVFGLGYALFYGKLRYRIPILPIVLAFAGVGVARVGQAVGGWPRAFASLPPFRARSHQ
jgi:4-amino-4-deoxy-L-arabinose transferase-like glycosyltransferase